MSAITVIPGYLPPDNQPVTTAQLRQIAQPSASIPAGSITGAELNLVQVGGALALSAGKVNFFDNANLAEPLWRFVGPVTCATGVDSSIAQSWQVKPAGAACTQAQSNVTPANNLSLFSLKVTGATGVTAVEIGENIPRYIAAGMRAVLGFSMQVRNDTGAAFVPKLLIYTPVVADDFTSTLTEQTGGINLQSCGNAAWTLCSATFDASAVAALANGARVVVQVPSGSLNGSGKSAAFVQARLELAAVTPFSAEAVDFDVVRNENALLNGNFYDAYWPSGATAVTAPAGADTYNALQWWCNPAGGSVTYQRDTATPDSLALFSAKLTGAAGVTQVDFGQNILRSVSAELRRKVTFSCLIFNGTGADFAPTLRLDAPVVANVFSAVTNISSIALQTCSNGVWTTVFATFEPTSVLNGLRIYLRFGALGAGAILNVAEAHLEIGAVRTPLRIMADFATQQAVIGTTSNLRIANNATNPTFQLDISADEVLAKSGATPLVLSALSVTADITASGLNGREAGFTPATNSWAYIWAIGNGNTVGALFSASATAPALPAGYSYQALLGHCFCPTATTVAVMFQTGRNVSVIDANVFTALAGATTYTALTGTPLTTFQQTIGPLAKMARGTMGISGTGNRNIAVSADASGVGAVSFSGLGITGTAINGFLACAPFRIPLKTAQLLYWEGNDTTSSYRLNVSGYEI